MERWHQNLYEKLDFLLMMKDSESRGFDKTDNNQMVQTVSLTQTDDIVTPRAYVSVTVNRHRLSFVTTTGTYLSSCSIKTFSWKRSCILS